MWNICNYCHRSVTRALPHPQILVCLSVMVWALGLRRWTGSATMHHQTLFPHFQACFQFSNVRIQCTGGKKLCPRLCIDCVSVSGLNAPWRKCEALIVSLKKEHNKKSYYTDFIPVLFVFLLYKALTVKTPRKDAFSCWSTCSKCFCSDLTFFVALKRERGGVS